MQSSREPLLKRIINWIQNQWIIVFFVLPLLLFTFISGIKDNIVGWLPYFNSHSDSTIVVKHFIAGSTEYYIEQIHNLKLETNRSFGAEYGIEIWNGCKTNYPKTVFVKRLMSLDKLGLENYVVLDSSNCDIVILTGYIDPDDAKNNTDKILKLNKILQEFDAIHLPDEIVEVKEVKYDIKFNNGKTIARSFKELNNRVSENIDSIINTFPPNQLPIKFSKDIITLPAAVLDSVHVQLNGYCGEAYKNIQVWFQYGYSPNNLNLRSEITTISSSPRPVSVIITNLLPNRYCFFQLNVWNGDFFKSSQVQEFKTKWLAKDQHSAKVLENGATPKDTALHVLTIGANLTDSTIQLNGYFTNAGGRIVVWFEYGPSLNSTTFLTNTKEIWSDYGSFSEVLPRNRSEKIKFFRAAVAVGGTLIKGQILQMENVINN